MTDSPATTPRPNTARETKKIAVSFMLKEQFESTRRRISCKKIESKRKLLLAVDPEMNKGVGMGKR